MFDRSKFTFLLLSQFIFHISCGQVSDTIHFRVSMRDGVELATTVLLPPGGGSFPVIFVRTPYGKEYQQKVRRHYVDNGYAVVVQDCRGTGESSGTFEPYLNEKADGADALDWIAAQPWCNGNVGMIGASYEGQVQWLAAASGHPALKTIVPQVAGTDPFFDVPYDNGILKLSMIDWAYRMTYPDREMNDYEWAKLYTLPIDRIDDGFYGVDVPIWNKWTTMDRPEDWVNARFLDDMKNVRIPVLHVSGNWDVEALSTQKNWLWSRSNGARDQHLLFGPWEHNAFIEELPTSFSGIEYGENSRLRFEEIWLRWFDRWLKNENAPAFNGSAPVKIFITGRNEWREMMDWPDKYFVQRVYHFDLNENRNGGYSLKGTATKTSIANFMYSPRSVALNMDPEFSESTFYHRDTAAHNDLVLTTDPFTRDMILCGPACADIEFSIDRQDVDLFVLLAEIDTSGELRALGHPGKVRAMFRNKEQLLPIAPGERLKATIDLFPFAHEFKAGSRLALILRSDWFPRYVRNPGTSNPVNDAGEMQDVKVSIHSASKLVLYEMPQ